LKGLDENGNPYTIFKSIKINDKQRFQELFTDYRTNKGYFDQKGVFKITVDKKVLDYFNSNGFFRYSIPICQKSITNMNAF
jgi:hypothetical protein